MTKPRVIILSVIGRFQAMACGFPLICTSNIGGEDIITRDEVKGYVLPIRDVEALKEIICYLYHNPKICPEMGERAKSKIQTGYTWDDYGARYVSNLMHITRTDVDK